MDDVSHVPVIFLVFNRPELTSRVFAQIRGAKPAKLFVVADGPRLGRPGELEKCQAVRQIVERGVDWPCKLVLDYSETNMGCGRRIYSGITNAFTQVEEAIILEDDCLPDPTFFRFCAELLDRYRNEPRVSVISGDNFQGAGWSCGHSYYFSRYPHCWGWATWRRAWQAYDFEMKDWSAGRDRRQWLKEITGSFVEARFWHKNFEAIRKSEIDTWDHQWTYACWKNRCVSVLPARNLVENLGFGADASHTTGAAKPGNGPASGMPFPLLHPEEIIPDRAADRHTFDHHHKPSSFFRRLFVRVLRILKKDDSDAV